MYFFSKIGFVFGLTAVFALGSVADELSPREFKCSTVAQGPGKDELNFTIALGDLDDSFSSQVLISVWFREQTNWFRPLSWDAENISISGTSSTVLKRFNFNIKNGHSNKFHYDPKSETYLFWGSANASWSDADPFKTEDEEFETTIKSGTYILQSRLGGVLSFDPVTTKYKGKAVLSFTGIGMTEEQLDQYHRREAQEDAKEEVAIKCSGPATRGWDVKEESADVKFKSRKLNVGAFDTPPFNLAVSINAPASTLELKELLEARFGDADDDEWDIRDNLWVNRVISIGEGFQVYEIQNPLSKDPSDKYAKDYMYFLTNGKDIEVAL